MADESLHERLTRLGFEYQGVETICNNSDLQKLSKGLSKVEKQVQEYEFDELMVVPAILVPEIPKEQWIKHHRKKWNPEFNRGTYVVYTRVNPNNNLIHNPNKKNNQGRSD